MSLSSSGTGRGLRTLPSQGIGPALARPPLKAVVATADAGEEDILRGSSGLSPNESLPLATLSEDSIAPGTQIFYLHELSRRVLRDLGRGHDATCHSAHCFTKQYG